MKRIKKTSVVIPVLLSMLLLLCAGCGAGTTAPQNAEASATSAETPAAVPSDAPAPRQPEELALREAKQHMLEAWSENLAIKEKLYHVQVWTYDYLESYLENLDWNDLSRARTACIAAVRFLAELQELADAAPDLNETDAELLYEANIDTEYVSYERAQLSNSIEDAHSRMRNSLLVDLESYYPFSNTELSILRDYLSLYREEINCFLEFECLMTNDLLLSLDLPEEAHAFWETLPSQYPTLGDGISAWRSDPGTIEQAAQEVLDRIEAQETLYSVIQSKQQSTLERMREAVLNKDIAAIADDACVISGLPILLPEPEWYDPEYTRYLSLVVNEDGTLSYPAAGDDLEGQQVSVYLQLDGIGRDDLEKYFKILKDYGVEYWLDEKTDSWTIRADHYLVSFDLEDTGISILFKDQDVTFAPIWYPALLEI